MVLGGIMLGFVAGQLTAGPLADRYGRRPMLIAALTVFLLASMACALAQSLFFLCAARFVQGCAAVFGPVLVRAIVRDAAENNNKFSSLILGIVKSPQFQARIKVKESGN